MDRREFLISTGSGAAVAALAGSAAKADTLAQPTPGAPSIATGRQTLSVSMPWADSGRGFGDGARRLALRILEATDGRIVLSFAPSDGQDAAASADVTFAPAYSAEPGRRGDLLALAYFAGLPGTGGLPIGDHLAWLSVGGGQLLWDDLAGDLGVKALAIGHTGRGGLLWSKAPVETLRDSEGRTIAVMGPSADVARGLGLEPLALASGREADFIEAGGAFQSLAADVHKTHSYALEGGLSQEGSLIAATFKRDVWEGLHPGDRTRIIYAADAELHASLAEARAHDALARRVLTSSFGVRFAPMPGDILAARDRVAEAAIAHIAAAGPKAQRINHSFMAFKALISDAIA